MWDAERCLPEFMTVLAFPARGGRAGCYAFNSKNAFEREQDWENAMMY